MFVSNSMLSTDPWLNVLGRNEPVNEIPSTFIYVTLDIGMDLIHTQAKTRLHKAQLTHTGLQFNKLCLTHKQS
jgi:hypothetical protein